jgi:hypothetical protein
MGARRLNAALEGLVVAKVMVRDGVDLVLGPNMRPVLMAADELVNRLRSARALTDRTVKRRTAPRKRRWYEDKNGQMRWRPAFVNGRRTLPPVGTSAWGRSMLGKKGGYARQRQCKALGINPTAQATAARLSQKRADPLSRSLHD